MLLAAGLGRRLRPLTVYRAKPALPLLGTPLIRYTAAGLERAGVREVVVNVHHQPESVREALSGPSSLAIQWSYEPEILGTAGGLKKVEHLLRPGPFFLINGDTLFELDFADLLLRHRQKKAAATLVLRRRPAGTDETAFDVDEKGWIRSMGEKSAHPWMFAGAWVLESEVFDRLPDAGFARLERELLPSLVQQRRAMAYLDTGAWFDIGTPRRYLAACLLMVRRGLLREHWRVRITEPTAASSPDALVAAGEGTVIDPQARLDGEVVLGAQCRVERGAVLQRSVLWDGVRVGRGARIRNSVVTDGVTLAAGSDTVGKVVMNQGERPDRFREREREGSLVVAAIRR